MRRVIVSILFYSALLSILLGACSIVQAILTRPLVAFLSDTKLVGLTLVIPSWTRWLVATAIVTVGLAIIYNNLRIRRVLQQAESYQVGLMKARKLIKEISWPEGQLDERSSQLLKMLEDSSYVRIGAYEWHLSETAPSTPVLVVASTTVIKLWAEIFHPPWHKEPVLVVRTIFSDGALIETWYPHFLFVIKTPNYVAIYEGLAEDIIEFQTTMIRRFKVTHGEPLAIHSMADLNESSPLRVHAMEIFMDTWQRWWLRYIRIVGFLAALFSVFAIFGPSSAVVIVVGMTTILWMFYLSDLRNMPLIGR